MKNNLCNDCKHAVWDMESVDNAYCEQIPTSKVLGEGNYVIRCSCYKSNNLFKIILDMLKND